MDSDSNREDLLDWFNTLWNADETLVRDVKTDILKYLEQLYKDTAPEFVYLKMLFHLFENYLSQQQADPLLEGKTRFTESAVWQQLYSFQRDGVRGIINKIDRHGGCVLADSVGLGKTFEALAVTKYYEISIWTKLV